MSFTTLRPVIDAACTRVDTKTEKAFEAAANKPEDARTVWANVFAISQEGYVLDALEPVARVIRDSTGQELDVEKIAAAYGAGIRRRAAGGESRSLAQIVDQYQTRQEGEQNDQ